MGTKKIHIRDLSLDELRTLIKDLGQPDYRYRQLAAWTYQKFAPDFDAMTELSKALREQLSLQAVVSTIELKDAQVSKLDGTRKYLFGLSDGEAIEAVLMRTGKRITLCISTQVGCPFDCAFCRTGRMQFRRNLTAGEILDQICYLRHECQEEAEKVNIVFMGMGEPLLNLDNLARAIRTLNDPEGLNTGSRRITVSTAGLPQQIRALADLRLKCSLAISLNAATETTRRRLMPALGAHSIKQILEAARYFYYTARRRVTLEYVLLEGINTSKDDAQALARLTAGQPFKINLIPYNPGKRTGGGKDGATPGEDISFKPISDKAIDRFVQLLLPDTPAVTVRRSRGADIEAACGQLWTRTLKGKTPP
jgi:23S rRNA (adenine2503-C2)-methyltransferase